MSRQRKVHQVVQHGEPWTCCDVLPEQVRVMGDVSVSVDAWRCLPRAAKCEACLGCGADRGSASHADILSVSLMLCGLAGSLPADAARLLADYVRGDAPALSPLLDLAEERGWHTPGNLPQPVGVEWPEATGHEHVWMPWRSGDRARTILEAPGSVRRCPCGLFEHEREALRRGAEMGLRRHTAR